MAGKISAISKMFMRTTFLKSSALPGYARIAVGLLIAAVSLFLALRNVSYDELKASISGAHLLLVLSALGSVGLNNLGKGLRWKLLMEQEGRALSLRRSLTIILASQALNTIYPARVGDVSRVYAGGERGRGWGFTLGTVVLEKLFDVIAYVLLFIILFVLMPLPAWANGSIITFAVVALTGLSLVWLLVNRPAWVTGLLDQVVNWAPRRFQPRLQDWLHSGLASAEIFHDRRALLKVMMWSAVVWGTAVLTNHLTLRALNFELPLAAPILVLMVLQAGLSLTSTPGGIGVIEYLSILALAVFGVPQAQALGFGILLHGIILMPQTLIGLVCIGILGMDRFTAKNKGKLATGPFDASAAKGVIAERDTAFSLPDRPE